MDNKTDLKYIFTLVYMLVNMQTVAAELNSMATHFVLQREVEAKDLDELALKN